ncbi:hypothetical protein NMY22_g8246 [Coprinellus aureogranulatus]|nr:hypothetical protein NMY22_g8246 [Coprinellus aureogranulatus]
MADGSIPYKDSAAKRVSSHMDKAAKLFKSVKCAFIGANCTETCLVSVLIQPGSEARPRNIDLLYRRYIDEEVGGEPEVGMRKDVQQSAWCIRRYPGACPRAPSFFWTIYTNAILFFVEVLVTSFFEDGASQDNSPGSDNVLVVPEEGRVLLFREL